jgi:primosomal protein N' (replication factor Y)
LVSKGIVKVEKELMQNFAFSPKSQLRQGSISLIKSVQKPVLVVGSLSRLLEHLVLLVESALSKNKSLSHILFSKLYASLSYEGTKAPFWRSGGFSLFL